MQSHRYRIEYFRNGDCIGTAISAGTLEATQQAARVGMAERKVDLVYIIDEATGVTIFVERRS